MGQRTTYATSSIGKVITNPRGARTTITFASPNVVTDPFGNQSQDFHEAISSSNRWRSWMLAGVRTSFTYQLQNNGAYLVSGIQKPGYNSGTGHGQYSFAYNNNNQVKAVVDEVGNRSTFVWDSLGNRAAVIDPFGQRTSYHL